MLRCWPWWPPFFWMYLQSLCVLRGFWWQNSEKCALTGGFVCLSLLCILLNSKYYCRLSYPTKCMSKVACLFETRVMTWSQKRTWNNWHNGPSTGNEQKVGYRLILISLSVPLCDVLSDCLSYVCHCIPKYMYENISF